MATLEDLNGPALMAGMSDLTYYLDGDGLIYVRGLVGEVVHGGPLPPDATEVDETAALARLNEIEAEQEAILAEVQAAGEALDQQRRDTIAEVCEQLGLTEEQCEILFGPRPDKGNQGQGNN